MKHLLLLILLLPLTAAAKRVDVTSYGAKVDSREDCTVAVRAAVAALESGDTLYFPVGRYDFFASLAAEHNYYESNTSDVFPKRLAILLRGVEDITIDGNNSMLVMHGQMQPLTVDSCRNIAVKNLSVDWDTPLTAEGLVTKVTGDGFFLAVDNTQFPHEIQNGKLVFTGEGWRSGIFSALEFRPYDMGGIAIIEPHTGDITSWMYSDYEVSRSGGSELFFKPSKAGSHLPTAGNHLVLRHNARAHAGIFIADSRDVSLNNVWVHHTGGLGVLSQYSENLTFVNSGVVPNAAKGRYLSGHDDGFHFMGCRGDIVVKNCRWQGLMDDPINIHGTSVRIMQIKGRRLLCRFMQEQSVGMEWGQAGNEVAFLDHSTLRTIAKNSIKSYRKISTTDFEVELTSSMPRDVKAGDALENLHWVPSSVTITDNLFGGGRARGLLVSVPSKVVIENNTFYGSGSAILIAGDANQWYETGAVKDVLIRGNRFMSPCNTSYYQFGEAIISIDPEIPEPTSEHPFHSNITIEDNTFYTANTALVFAKSVKDLVFKNNTVVKTDLYTPATWDGKERVRLVECVNAQIELLDQKIDL